MSVPILGSDDSWNQIEAFLISELAYERYILVEPEWVLQHIAIWRQWYHGLIPNSAVMYLPGVRNIGVSGR